MRSLVVVQLDSRTPTVTTRADLVAEGMEALTGLSEQDESHGVRAVAGHWHPNGTEPARTAVPAGAEPPNR